MIPHIKPEDDGRMETETEGMTFTQIHSPLFSEDWAPQNNIYQPSFPHAQINPYAFHMPNGHSIGPCQCKCHCSGQWDNRLPSISNNQVQIPLFSGNPNPNPLNIMSPPQSQPFEQFRDLPNFLSQQNIFSSSNPEIFQGQPEEPSRIDNLFEGNSNPNPLSILSPPQPQPFEQFRDLPNFLSQQNIFQSSNQEIFQGRPEEPSRIDDLFDRPLDQNITLGSISNQDLALSFNHGSDWDEHELWGADSQDSLVQDQDIGNTETSISLNHAGIDLNSNLGQLIFNDVSSILDPIEKDIRLNLSNHSDTSDGEPFEKKRKLENTESKQKVSVINEKDIPEKWQDVPRRIISSIKRGCKYYFTQKGIKLASINRVLERKAIDSQQKFEKFIVKYKNTCETWDAIINYVFEEGDNETIWILMELIYELLSNKEDVEDWLSKIKMPEKTKNHIRVSKDMLRDNFIFHLYPLSQSWIKTVY